jgi:hypothetical protein
VVRLEAVLNFLIPGYKVCTNLCSSVRNCILLSKTWPATFLRNLSLCGNNVMSFLQYDTGLMIHVYYNRFESTSAYDCLRTESKCELMSNHCTLGLVGLCPVQDDEHNSAHVGIIAVRLCVCGSVMSRDISVWVKGLHRFYVGD